MLNQPHFESFGKEISGMSLISFIACCTVPYSEPLSFEFQLFPIIAREIHQAALALIQRNGLKPFKCLKVLRIN